MSDSVCHDVKLYQPAVFCWERRCATVLIQVHWQLHRPWSPASIASLTWSLSGIAWIDCNFFKILLHKQHSVWMPKFRHKAAFKFSITKWIWKPHSVIAENFPACWPCREVTTLVTHCHYMTQIFTKWKYHGTTSRHVNLALSHPTQCRYYCLGIPMFASCNEPTSHITTSGYYSWSWWKRIQHFFSHWQGP